MCEQCLTDAELISRTVLPGITLMRARKGIDTWPAGWFGLIECNDPFLVLEGPLVASPLVADEAEDELTAEQEVEYERFHQAAMRLGKPLESLPAMTGYYLVKACMAAGYDPEKHGHSLEYWLMHRLATAAASPAPETPIWRNQVGWFDVDAYSTKELWEGPDAADAGLDGFNTLTAAIEHANSDNYKDHYQVTVVALGQHAEYEAGQRVYHRFSRDAV